MNTPISYSTQSGIASMNCDTTSGGVTMAAMMKAMKGEKVSAPYLLDDMAADAIGLLDSLGIDTAHMVGASMGGMIVQILAGKYPQRTRSMVSIFCPVCRAMISFSRPFKKRISFA